MTFATDSAMIAASMSDARAECEHGIYAPHRVGYNTTWCPGAAAEGGLILEAAAIQCQAAADAEIDAAAGEPWPHYANKAHQILIPLLQALERRLEAGESRRAEAPMTEPEKQYAFGVADGYELRKREEDAGRTLPSLQTLLSEIALDDILFAAEQCEGSEVGARLFWLQRELRFALAAAGKPETRTTSEVTELRRKLAHADQALSPGRQTIECPCVEQESQYDCHRPECAWALPCCKTAIALAVGAATKEDG